MEQEQEQEPTSKDVIEELEQLVSSERAPDLASALKRLPPADAGWVLSRIKEEQRARMFALLSAEDPELAATLIDHVADEQAARFISVLPPEAAAAIVDEMESDQQADILERLKDEDAQAILIEMDPEDAEEVRRLVQYPSDTAGGLMITEYLAHPGSRRIDEVLADLRANAEQYAKYDVQYVYVTDDGGALAGVIRLRDLVLTPGMRTIASIMIAKPAHVKVDDRQQELEHFFDHHAFFAAPVVDAAGLLVGVVRRAAVEKAHAAQAERTFLAFGGIIGGEELRSMPTPNRIARRLAFLCPNILLNVLAASVVALYEPTIAAVTALAIFLPMLSDMSGCAGNQAVAVSIRELSIGVLKPTDLFHTLSKEVGVGIVNGIVLGTLIGIIAWVMRGGEWPLIGVVVGLAMALNSVVAGAVGGSVPLFLKRLGIDPALASSPLLTTFTDMCGFFLTLSLASAILL
jgi:magnesium transporter